MIDYREKLTSIRLNERTLANEPNNYVSDEPRQNKGRWLVNRKLDEAPPPLPSNFIVSRPKAALLFWFFGGFRCDVWVFIVLLVRYKNRK